MKNGLTLLDSEIQPLKHPATLGSLVYATFNYMKGSYVIIGLLPILVFWVLSPSINIRPHQF